MKTCENCGGEGGFETSVPTSRWADDPYVTDWVDCPTCDGTGWVDGEPEPLTIDDLEERSGETL